MHKAFLVGIGGYGMSKLAFLLKEEGFYVSGTDIKESSNVKHLREEGIKVFVDNGSSHIDSTFDLLVYSSAIPQNHPDLLKAQETGIKVRKRGEILAEIVNNYRPIVVSGTHGKTTTTALIGHVLRGECRLNAYIGGDVEGFDHFLKNPDYFVVESDESDGSFLLLKPHILVMLNIDKDHLNFYNWSFENLKTAFRTIAICANSIVVCMDDEPALSIANDLDKEVLYYSICDERADFYGSNIKVVENGIFFDMKHKGIQYRDIFVPLRGAHNVRNSLASIAVASFIGLDVEYCINALSSFSPPKRRIEKKWEYGSIILFDDHADHPTEVEATLTALKSSFPQRRLIAVLQPHRYTRVKSLGHEIVKPLNIADVVILTDIYSAFETPIEGISGEAIFEWARSLYPDRKIMYVEDKIIVPHLLKEILKENDVVVLLGPGDIGEISEALLDTLKGRFYEEKC